MSASPKKAKSALSKKVKAKSSRPKIADMVKLAIKRLQEKDGSSLRAIKKYMAATFKVDTKKQAPFIKRSIKCALKSGALVQTKGKGAAGSFKLPSPVGKPTAVKRVGIRLKTVKKHRALKKATTSSKLKKVAGKRSRNATVQRKNINKRSAGKSRNVKTSRAKSTSKSLCRKVRITALRKSKSSPKSKRTAVSMK